MLQAILPEKHMIDDRAHAHCGRAVNNYFVRSIVRGRIRFTGARNNCVIGYKGQPVSGPRPRPFIAGRVACAYAQTELRSCRHLYIAVLKYGRHQKKVPPYDLFNGRPFKKNGRRTGIER